MKLLVLSLSSLVMLAVPLLYAANVSIQNAVSQEIVRRGDAAQATIVYLAAQHGPAHIDRSGNLAFGTWSAKGDHSLVDTVKALTGAEATVFQTVGGVPMRVTTTVRKADGDGRLDGTKLTPGGALSAYVHGTDYTGENSVSGMPYVGHYHVLRDPSGAPIGILCTIVPLAAAERASALAMAFMLLTAAVALGVVGSLFLLVSRRMSRTPAQIAGSMHAIVATDIPMLNCALKGLAAGDLTLRVVSDRPALPVRGTDEFGTLAAAYNALAAALHSSAVEYERSTERLTELISTVAETGVALETASEHSSGATKSANWPIGHERRRPTSRRSWIRCAGTRRRSLR